MKLIANIPILYLAHQYKSGEELPCDDESMVAAWLINKSAHWEKEKQEEEKSIEGIGRRGKRGRNDF